MKLKNDKQTFDVTCPFHRKNQVKEKDQKSLTAILDREFYKHWFKIADKQSTREKKGRDMKTVRVYCKLG